MTGDRYANTFWIITFEILGNIVAYFILKISRRKGITFFFFAMSVSCLEILLVQEKEKYWIRVAFTIVGKMWNSAGLVGLFIYSCELFPTAVRCQGLGICTSSAYFGSLIAPYVVYFQPMMSLFVISTLGILAGVLNLLLPDTSKSPLPTSMDDMQSANCSFGFLCPQTYEVVTSE